MVGCHTTVLALGPPSGELDSASSHVCLEADLSPVELQMSPQPNLTPDCSLVRDLGMRTRLDSAGLLRHRDCEVMTVLL